MMDATEIEEFSTLENFVKFMKTTNLPAFVEKYFAIEPAYTKVIGEIGGTYITFSEIPLQIKVNKDAELSLFLYLDRPNSGKINILKFINYKTKIDEILSFFGDPDFEINEDKRIQLDAKYKIVKYFIDEIFSISFDYDENIRMISVFRDRFRVGRHPQ